MIVITGLQALLIILLCLVKLFGLKDLIKNLVLANIGVTKTNSPIVGMEQK